MVRPNLAPCYQQAKKTSATGLRTEGRQPPLLHRAYVTDNGDPTTPQGLCH